MSNTPKIHDLVDYPSIKKLASALFRLNASHHGAAIMIGAGFSRSGACHVGGKKKIPLWSEFTRSLARELCIEEQDLSFADPLRIAEEYRAYFGQAALNDRIRFEIEDEAWRAGPLYSALLELPWSEILTTNWDTLLERAATKIHSPYYTSVTKTSDLAWAQSPRIVKLHGTIGVTDSFVAAQEDYRTYPERFAPFVNLARQVFIENEFCLLGFSGDDPNFLQWAGWVRDHLASHARKIYLVGALNLSASHRKQLEWIGVAPVDLWPTVAHIKDADLRHRRAIELFLTALKEEEKSRTKPHEWLPKDLFTDSGNSVDHTRLLSDPEYGASLLAEQLDSLRQDRESYPGWVVCPPALRSRLSNQISAPYLTQKTLEVLPPVDRTRLLYEIAWRSNVTSEYISPWLSDALFDVVNLDHPSAINTRQQLEIAVTLLFNSRWLQGDGQEEQKIIDEHIGSLLQILEKNAAYVPDCSAEIAYYHALDARDRLDYDSLAKAVEGVIGEDPVWKLRNAALLAELGRSDEAASLVAEAYGELRENHRRDRQSIPILSRLLWAHWLLGAFNQGNFTQPPEELPAFVESNYRKWKCDPWSWIDDLRQSIYRRQENYLESQRRIEPQFEQGHYRDRSNDVIVNNYNVDFLFLDGLSRTVGIPLRFDSGFGVNLLASDAEKIILFGGTTVGLWDQTLTIRSANSDNSSAIKGLFTRIGVACMDQDTIDVLVTRIQSAVLFWKKALNQGFNGRQLNARSRLRVLVEVLARLAIRMPTTKAKDLFLLALSLGQEPKLQHDQFSKVLDDLLRHSLKSISESEQENLLIKALAFPLCQAQPHWPNPVIQHLSDRDKYPTIDTYITQLIETAASENSRSVALIRLLPLVEKTDFLTENERSRLAFSIWGNLPQYQTLPETELFPHAFLILPAPNAERAKALVRANLYDHGEDVLEDTQQELRSYPSPEINRAVSIYDGIANAAASERTQLFPTPDQAILLFDRLVRWRPPIVAPSPFQFEEGERRRLAESIGRALSYAIAPALPLEAKNDSRMGQLKEFYEEVNGAKTALPALVYFSIVNRQSDGIVAKIFQSALRSRDSKRVSYSAIGLKLWMSLAECTSSAEFKNLISMVISIIESGRNVGLAQLLWIAREFLNRRILSKDQSETLIEVVPNIFEATDYNNIDPNGPEAVSASTIRAECARLAQKLLQQSADVSKLLEVVKESRTDPLPEVRFALNSNQ